MLLQDVLQHRPIKQGRITETGHREDDALGAVPADALHKIQAFFS